MPVLRNSLVEHRLMMAQNGTIPGWGQQIGVRGGAMATWVSIAGEDREYDSGAIESGVWTHIAFYV